MYGETMLVIEPQESQDHLESSETALGYADAASPMPSKEYEASGSAMAPYVVKVFAVMLLLYVAPFFIARSDFYERYSLSFYSRPLNYAYNTAGQNADVVLFGDSTALLGLDPSQMSSELGLKVVNLPNTHGSLIVNDDMALRHYLAGNRPPKLIVFYFAPWDFDYGHVPFEATPVYEGEELLMRQGSARQILTFVVRHPSEAINFPLRFYGDSWQFAMHKVSHDGQEKRLAETRGHIDNTDFSVLPVNCKFPALLLDNIRFDWVRGLTEKYAAAGFQVLDFVAPVPSCANVSTLLNQPYVQLPAAPPVQLPPGTFVRDIRYIHPHPDAVPSITHNLAEAVRSALEPQDRK